MHIALQPNLELYANVINLILNRYWQ